MRLRSLVLLVALSTPLLAAESVIRLESVQAPTPALAASNAIGAGIAAADFDRDGKLDAAVTFGTDSIAILRGKGDGTFNSATTFKTSGSRLSRIVTADMNHDGLADLIAADYTAGTVMVYRGNGNGGFTETAVAPSGKSGAWDMAIADLNHDGENDVILAEGAFLAVFLGDGHGALAPLPAVAPVASDPIQTVNVADFDRDGKLDVVLALSTSVRLMRGNGDGTFKTAQTIFSVTPPLPNVGFVSAEAGDLNRDGAPDLIAANEVNKTLSILMNRGDGTFRAPEELADTSGGLPRFAAVDLNRDTIPDLTVLTITLMTAYRGKGDGTFTTTWPAGIPISASANITFGDFDGDGRIDEALVYANGSVAVMRNITGLSKTLLNASSLNTVSGQPVQLTVSVQQDFLDTLFHSVSDKPGGSVTIREGGKTVATQQLVDGKAEIAFESSTAGDHTLTATYTGETGEWDASTSAPLVVHVSAAPPATTTTAISATPSSFPFGTASINVTATVTSTSTPSGTLRFTADSAVTDVTLASGTASLSLDTSAMSVGAHTVTAAYLGDSTHGSSTSAPLTLTVTKGTIAMTLAVTPDNGAYRISVNGNFAHATGTLTLNVDGSNVDTQPADGARQFVRELALGTHTITVSYSGDANYNASTSAPYTLTITPAPPRRRAARH